MSSFGLSCIFNKRKNKSPRTRIVFTSHRRFGVSFEYDSASCSFLLLSIFHTMSEQIKLLDVTSEQDLDPLALIFSETLVNLGPFFPAGPNPEHVAWRRGQLAKSLEKIKEEEASGKRNKSPLDQTHLVKAVRTDTNEIVGLLLYKIIPSTEGKTTKDEAPKPDPTLPDDVDESWTRFLGIVKGMTKKFMGQRAFVCE